MTPIQPYKPSSTDGLLEKIKTPYQDQEGCLKSPWKQILIGFAAVGVGLGLYLGIVNRNHAPVIDSANLSSQQAYILEDGTSKGIQINANASDQDEGDKGLDGVVREISGPSGKDSQKMEGTNGSFSSTYKPEVTGNYTVTLTAIDGKGKKSKSETLEFEAILDRKAEIESYEVSPLVIYNGDNIETLVNAKDDIAIESVAVNMTDPDGIVTTMFSDRGANSPYKIVHKTNQPGIYWLDIIVVDSAGQITVTKQKLEVHPYYSPEISDDGVPSSVKPGQEFKPSAEVNGTCIESVILEIEGIGKFYYENKGNNIWEIPEEISISEEGKRNYTFTVIGCRETITKEDTINVRTSSGGGGGGDGNGGGGPGITGG
jgi:hypothetical protein